MGLITPNHQNAKELRLAQMDAVLQETAKHPLPPRPPAGWLRAIGEALGMTSGVLAETAEALDCPPLPAEPAGPVAAITEGDYRELLLP